MVYPLAYHFSHTSDLKRAFEYTTIAANMAMRSFALSEAQRYLETALDILLKREDIEDQETKEADLLSRLGEISSFLGDWKKALDYHHEALNLYDIGSKARAKTLTKIGEVEMGRYEWDSARRAFERSIEICEKLNDTHGLAENYRCVAWSSFEIGDTEEGLHYADKALEEAKKARDNYLMGKVLIDIGNSFNVLNKYYEAIDRYEEAIRVLDPEKDLDQVARAMNNLGDVYLKMGEFDRAVTYFEKCLDIAKRTGYQMLEAFATSNLADSYYKKGEREKAVEFVDKALKLCKKLDNKFMTGQMYVLWGQLATEDGDIEAARGFFSMAMEISEQHNLPVCLASAWREYGIMLRGIGEKAEARKFLMKSLELFEQLGSEVQVSRVRKELKGLK
jgi:tetratricopeptide (TPR) repeat protein